MINNSDILTSKTELKNDDNHQKLSAPKVVAKILKFLRENNFHLLGSVFQDFKDAKIEKNKLILSFDGENYQEILEKSENINLINDIIKVDFLVVEYNYIKEKESKNVENILKEKFSKIEIKE